MKAYQQEAVLYHKIDKLVAEEAAGKQADQLQKDLSDLPIVKDIVTRCKMLVIWFNTSRKTWKRKLTRS